MTTSIEICDLCGERRECVTIYVEMNYYNVYVCFKCLQRLGGEFI